MMTRGVIVGCAFGLTATLAFLGASPASSQRAEPMRKVANCEGLKVLVDRKLPDGSWDVGAAQLALFEDGIPRLGGGHDGKWLVEAPQDRRGEILKASLGEEIRFRFLESDVPLNVLAKPQRRVTIEQPEPSIALVRVSAEANTPLMATFSFEVADGEEPDGRLSRREYRQRAAEGTLGCRGGAIRLDLFE